MKNRIDLFNSINKKFDKQKELLGNAKDAAEVPFNDEIEFFEISTDIVAEISNYISQQLPVTPFNLPYMIVALRYAADCLESTMETERKERAEQLLDMIKTLCEATVITIPEKDYEK